MVKWKSRAADAAPGQVRPENLVDAAKMRRDFAKLDAHIRDKVAEIGERAKEGGQVYEMAVRACNRAERRKN